MSKTSLENMNPGMVVLEQPYQDVRIKGFGKYSGKIGQVVAGQGYDVWVVQIQVSNFNETMSEILFLNVAGSMLEIVEAAQ